MQDRKNSLYETFFQDFTERRDRMIRNGTKFVHYTSAEAALSIMQNKSVWLRNARVMNDFSEVDHGNKCLLEAWYHPQIGAQFQKALGDVHFGLDALVSKYFGAGDRNRFLNSYLLSISEHGSDEVDEDQHGRLSMWRAYGGDTNVALVLNNSIFFEETADLASYTIPVSYADSDAFLTKFQEKSELIYNNISELREIGIQELAAAISHMMHMYVLSTKHPGFAEEREWRVILDPGNRPSNQITSEIKVISGVPQRIFKISLIDQTHGRLKNIEVPQLLHHVIIGPTQYPWPIFDAFSEALHEAGAGDKENLIRVSGIPLRR